MKKKQSDETRNSVKFTAVIIFIVVTFAILEGVSRVAYEYRDDLKRLTTTFMKQNIMNGLSLDPYEIPATDIPGHWRLRPGFRATNTEIAEAKKNAGKVLGVAALKGLPNKGMEDNEPELTINSLGFKGPEIELKSNRVRVLMLGDSVTFGFGSLSYPRVVEKWLNGMGRPVDVINAGVEGYSPINTVYEFPRYLKLKPDIVTIYLGWNSLFSIDQVETPYERIVRSVWLLHRVWYLLTVLIEDPKTRAKILYSRALTPDLKEAKSMVADGYVPAFIKDIKTLIDGFQSKDIKVVILTLPGLFSTAEVPTEKALKKGHLPEFTTNPYVLARLSEQYNIALRALAGAQGVQVMDLEKWGVEELQPRDQYFSDSVHLTSQGLEKVGQKIATELLPMIKGNFKNRAPDE